MDKRSPVTNMEFARETQATPILHQKAAVCMEAGQFGAALVCFDQTIQANPEDAAAWYGRGDALANLGRYREALSSFEHALKLHPGNHEAWTFRAVVLIHLRHYAEALASCEQALQIAPDDSEAWMFRGVALHHLERYQQAYSSYARAMPRRGHPQRLGLIQRIHQLLQRVHWAE